MANKKERDYYVRMLKIIGSLTNLFSDSKVPYLNYRVTENLFCKAFNAKNLSRSDVSADASLNNKGIGIKTFENKNGKTFQKIAEFNKDHIEFKKLPPEKLVKKIAELRNKRIDATKRIYKLNSMIYHCIARDEGKIKIFECDMDTIDINSIKDIKESKNTITFKDPLNEYSFNITKSTLYKKFITKNIILNIDVRIINNPFEILENKFAEVKNIYYKKTISEKSFVILPLYSVTKNKKIVYSKSGLNQWNAGGRKRDFNEIYVQIPKWIHKRFPAFFLPRDTHFNLVLPDGKILEAKICQEGSKALMSKHNADLGKWLLRAVLNLKTKELLTYEKLQEIGLDSVIIERLDSKTFSIDFRPVGTYEKFIKENS